MEMSVIYASVEDRSSGQKGEELQKLEKDLASVLSKLKKDDKNADLWLKAAKLYREMGDLEKALKCAEVCLTIDKKKRAAKLLVTKVKKEMAALEEAEGRTAEEAEEVAEVEEEAPQPAGRGEARTAPVVWVPEEERPRFRSEEEALEQLRRELSTSSTITCPTCNTLLEMDAAYCYGCGLEITGKFETLEQRIEVAKSRLEENEGDSDALFTLGAYLAVEGQLQEALEVLNRLTMVEQTYPGLWWLKARVFEQMGKRQAAESSMRRAVQLESGEGGSE
jgi:tetratricopeptide (TPR) repeat protein